MAGYNEMLRQIEPERIICYNTPFPEMEGNIVYVDYDRSSWRYMNYERSLLKEDLDAYKIGGTMPTDHDMLAPYMVGKGSGSAYGGKWKPNPNKPNEVILQGPPNSIQKVYIQTRKEGYWALVKYNNEGWAVKMRHFTDHGNSNQHTDPHDKEIEYDPNNGTPDFQTHPDQNYPVEDYPNGPPEFKKYGESDVRIFGYDAEAWRFKTISEFKNSVNRGAEINFEWEDKEYHICPVWINRQAKFSICCLDTRTEKVYDNAAQMLEHMVGDVRLGDIVTQVIVTDRTL